MTHISRPLQIALVAVVLLAAVWFVALRGHSSSPEQSPAPATPAASASSASSAASSTAATPSASGNAGSSASSGGTYHGSAPGVDGLTRAIAKAHQAAAQTQQNTSALRQKEAAVSGGSPAQSSAKATSGTTHASTAATHSTAAAAKSTSHGATKTHSSASGATAKTTTPKTTATKTASGIPVMQARVEAELKQGKVAALLFWNPKGTVDTTVRRELLAASRKLHGGLVVHVARSSQVGLFGTFTRTVQVYSTPTILLVNPQAKTASLTGLTDVFSIEQAVREVKQAK